MEPEKYKGFSATIDKSMPNHDKKSGSIYNPHRKGNKGRLEETTASSSGSINDDLGGQLIRRKVT